MRALLWRAAPTKPATQEMDYVLRRVINRLLVLACQFFDSLATQTQRWSKSHSSVKSTCTQQI